MSAGNVTGEEFVSKLSFNFDPALDLSGLDFTYAEGAEADKILKKRDSIKTAGGGEYDISFVFPKKG